MEIDLYCKEHGYINSSNWIGTIEYLWVQHLLTAGEHEQIWKRGFISEEERMKRDIEEAST